MLDRRSLILGLAAAVLLPGLDAGAASKDKGGTSKGGKNNKNNKSKKSRQGGQGSGNGGGSGNAGGNGSGNAGGNGNANGANGVASATNPSTDQALNAVRSGKALPLREIQAIIGPQYPGLLIEATLQSRGTVLFYDLTMLSPQGRVFVVTVNAATGMIATR
jgi:uncharacterized membrane protein YkoI